jgi:DNA-binding response OmpR family regulator
MARILLVEDEDAILRILTTFLSKHGHVVLPFCDGEPALEALRGEDVDVIITDLSMPTPGEEVIRLARLQDFNGPIVVMSGTLSTEDASDCEVIGADMTLKKPFALDELTQLVDALVV